MRTDRSLPAVRRAAASPGLRGLWVCLLLATCAVAWTPPLFSRLDSLFLTAATGEPRYQAARAAAEQALRADSATLPYLLENRLRRQTPRQQQYVERLFTLASDSGRNARPRLLLAAALRSGLSDTLCFQILYIGSKLGDTAFLPEALPWLNASFEPARRMAVRSLGAYPRGPNLPRLWSGLSETRGLERQQRLWALGAQEPLRDWRTLTPLLEDSLFFNRRTVRDMLLKATDSSWSVLRSGLPTRPSAAVRHEWRLLAQDAKGGREFLEAEKTALTADERRYFGVE
jgi:hypothetical protein